MSNPLNYIDGLGTNTYTVKSSIPINITSLSGKTIKYNIDFTNNYVYWLFEISDLSYNITTTVDINNLGFVIVGDTNNYKNKFGIRREYHPFSLVTHSELIVKYEFAQTMKEYDNEFTNHIIYGCDFGINHTGGPGEAPDHRDNKNDQKKNKYPVDDLNGILYQYCYKPFYQPNNSLWHNRTNIQLSDVYNISKQNLTNISFLLNLGSIGGISKGNIPIFNSNKNISITKTTTPGVVHYPWPDNYDKYNYPNLTTTGYIKTGLLTSEDYYTNTYDLKYNNNTVTTTSADYFNNYAGSGTTISNSDIDSIEIKGNNYNRVFEYTLDYSPLGAPFIDYQPIFNCIKTQSDILMPSITMPNIITSVNNNSQPVNVDIPFTIKTNATSNILFDDNNNNLVFYPEGIQSMNTTSTYNNTYNINYHNRRFVPFATNGANSRELCETDNITCLNLPIYSHNIISRYQATPSFALIYYPFSRPAIEIPSNVTNLFIDVNVVIPIIYINLSTTAPVNYVLTIKNDGLKEIRTNSIEHYKNIASIEKNGSRLKVVYTNTKVNEKYICSSKIITFTFISSSSGNYWSIITQN